MSNPWNVPVGAERGNVANNLPNLNNNINNTRAPQQSEWEALVAIARSNVPDDEAPRINRSLQAIEKESARLVSRHATRIPSSQMYALYTMLTLMIIIITLLLC